jgi:hypothetical protein
MPCAFWAFADEHQAVVLGIYSSRLEMRADLARMASVPGVKVTESVVLPMSSFDNGNFLDFRPIVGGPVDAPGMEPADVTGPAQTDVPCPKRQVAPSLKPVGVPAREPVEGLAMSAGRFRPLLGFEMEAFQALIQEPEEGATALARRLGITRSAFIDRTEEIEHERLYWTVVVPDIQFIGLGTLAIWSAGGGETGAGENGAGEAVTAPVEQVSPTSEVEDGVEPVQGTETGDPLPFDPKPGPEREAVLHKGIPASLKDGRIPEAGESAGLEEKSPPLSAKAPEPEEEEPSAMAKGHVIMEKHPEEAGGTSPDPDDGKMPWQFSTLARPVRSGFEAAPRWESQASRGTKGIEALPKDLRRMLIGRPSKDAVEHVKAELDRRRIRDIDLNRILQDAGVLPARRRAPAAPVIPTVSPGVHTAVPTVSASLPRRQGHPPKNVVIPVPVPGPVPRRRGRPPKNAVMPTLVPDPVPRRRGRPPKNARKMAPVPCPFPQAATAMVVPAGNAGEPLPVVRRKRGRPRKNPMPEKQKTKTGYRAMAMEEFTIRPEGPGRKGRKLDGEHSEGDKAGAGKGPEDGLATGSATLPLFLDAREGGRRFMMGFFPDRDSALRVHEQILREVGPGVRLRLISVWQLEVLKELAFGPVLRQILASN